LPTQLQRQTKSNLAAMVSLSSATPDHHVNSSLGPLGSFKTGARLASENGDLRRSYD